MKNEIVCKHCGKPVRVPVALHAACYELAVEEVIEKICDDYCRYPGECASQEELNTHCDDCELVRLMNILEEN